MTNKMVKIKVLKKQKFQVWIFQKLDMKNFMIDIQLFFEKIILYFILLDKPKLLKMGFHVKIWKICKQKLVNKRNMFQSAIVCLKNWKMKIRPVFWSFEMAETAIQYHFQRNLLTNFTMSKKQMSITTQNILTKSEAKHSTNKLGKILFLAKKKNFIR